MQIERHDLYRIIAEEYLMSEGYWDHPGDDAAEELLKKILGDKYEPPEKRGATRHITKGGDSTPMKKPHTGADETMPLPTGDMPQYDDEDVDAGDPQENSVVDQIAALVQGLDPEEVAEMFQAVFVNVPGVELEEPDEEAPETLYSPGAEGRPQVGFKLEELMTLIREVMSEGHYHDMGGEDEMYNAIDPYGFDEMTDAQIVDQAWRDGLEEIIALDGEGDLANREEVMVALKNV